MPEQEFEYMVERFHGAVADDEHTHYVNAIAAHGWRLIAVTSTTMNTQVMYFERPVVKSDG